MDCFFLGMVRFILEPCVARNKEERGGGDPTFLLVVGGRPRREILGGVPSKEGLGMECPVRLILSELSETGALWALGGDLGRVWVDEEREGGEH